MHIIKRHKNLFIFLIVVIVIVPLIWAGYQAGWTGFSVKKLWDWMQLFLIPAVLAGGAFLLNRADKKAESKRALDRQRQETLINYFDQMQKLLIEHHLRDPKKGEEARIVAKARTVSALRNLDGHRIAQLLRFLTEAGLGGDKLLEINLDKFDLQGINLSGVDLQGVSFVGANLHGAFFIGAKLQKAVFGFANLQKAGLLGADLQGANLGEANLQGAILGDANLQGVYLHGANLQKAVLSRTNLQGVVFSGVSLRMASLDGANLQGTILSEANLQMTNLHRANLQGASIKKEQLIGNILWDTIMPDGTKYEDWVAKGCPDWNKKTDENKEKA